MKAKIVSFDNKEVGEVELKDAIFGLPLRQDILHRAVQWQLAKRRAGTHKTKGISEIQGTTKKPFRQKGTGNARQGSLRSPQFRGGATIFGPVVRDHGYDLPKKIRLLALKTALSAKQAEGKLKIVKEASLKEPRTKLALAALKNIRMTSALIIDGESVDTNFALATRNLMDITVLPQIGANVYDILRHDTLILTKSALEQLEARLS
ncbi:MAG: 50S ribosomal protein L4 [Alphaproteobacteria bacterium]|nr:50S ribosomal protein L4 [Alphaproteobacteria bacterium]